ncbi:hypothetical protein PMAYCL1PPCAC_22190, partial [Pristionchus mayeri]
ISGTVLFVLNACVCIVIIVDKDPRGKAYRKYLVALQDSSTASDLIINAYSPVVLLNCRMIYSDSFLAHYLSVSTVPAGARFRYRGWRYFVVLVFVQILALAGYFLLCRVAL